MSTLSSGTFNEFTLVSLSHGSGLHNSVNQTRMGIERTTVIKVEHWDIHQSLSVPKSEKYALTVRNKFFLNFRYYPVLSILMLAPAIVSVTLLGAYLAYDAITINPGVLLWSFIGFGGMYAVLVSAAREIYGSEQNKA